METFDTDDVKQHFFEIILGKKYENSRKKRIKIERCMETKLKFRN